MRLATEMESLLKRAQRALDRVEAQVATPWRLAAWAGSLGFGLAVFLAIASGLHFEYRSFRDIVATSAFENYPEQQDLWLYLLALLVVPLAAVLAYCCWGALVLRWKDSPREAGHRLIAATSLALLPFWIVPLLRSMPACLLLIIVAGLVLLASVIVAAAGRCQHLRAVERLGALPQPAMQGAVTLLGFGLGITLLRSPLPVSLMPSPAVVVLITSLGVWTLWLAGSRLLAGLRHVAWQDTAWALALGLLPLSLSYASCVLWWEVWQGESLVAQHGFRWAVPLLWIASAVGGLAVAVGALRSLERRRGPNRGLFWRWFWSLAVPLLIYAVAYDPNVYRALDLFHEGERLAPAQALLLGGRPYADVLFVHGFGRDPGVTLAAFGLFGRSIASLRLLEQLLVPLSLVATYGLLALAAGGRWALLYVVLAFTGLFPLFYGWWIVPGVAAFTCLVFYLRRRRPAWLAAGGLLSVLSLAVAYDIGLQTLLSGAIFCLALTVVDWRATRLRPLVAYVLPLLGGLVVLWLYCASQGIWDELLSWHGQILTVYRDWNGMPFPASPENPGRAWRSFLAPSASLLAIVVLLVTLLRRRWRDWSSMALLFLAGNILLFNRAIVGGFTSGSQLAQASHFAPLLLLLIGHKSAIRRPLSVALSLVAVVSVFVSFSGTSQYPRSLLTVLDNVARKNQVELAPSWVPSEIDGIGFLFLPAEQEHSLAEIGAFLAGETYWDLTDHGALFYLTASRSPTRFYATHHVITGENQLEVIRDLEEGRPRYILYRSGTGWDAIAGVDRTLRSFLVAEYLLKNYHFAGWVGGFAVLEIEPPTGPDPSVQYRVDLGFVPFLWGRDRAAELARLEPALEASWDWGSACDRLGWQSLQSLPFALTEGGWRLQAGNRDSGLEVEGLALDPQRVTYMVLTLGAEGVCEARTQAQVLWRSSGEEMAEERSVVFYLRPDGVQHQYLLRLASFPAWGWSGLVEGLRVEFSTCPEVEVTVRSVDLQRVQEW
jgi:hypothetical protein